MNDEIKNGTLGTVNVGKNTIEVRVLATEGKTLTVENLKSGKTFTTTEGRLTVTAPAAEPQEAPKAPKKTTLLNIAIATIKAEGKPLSAIEVIRKATETGLFKPEDWGKTPSQTLYSNLHKEAKKPEPRLRKAEEKGKWTLA